MMFGIVIAADVKEEHTSLSGSDPGQCNKPTEHGSTSTSIQQWNPMERDFLASKNNYAYDEEDASIVMQGYSKCISGAHIQ